MSEPVILIFPTGMEVIGSVVEESATEIVLEKPVILAYEQPQQDPQNPGKKSSFSFGFAPFAPLTNDKKTFYKAGLVAKAEPKQGLKNAYQQATGSIVTPPAAANNPEILLLG